MDVDVRCSEDQCGPVSIQEQAFDQPDTTPAREPWSGWASVVDPPAPEPAAQSVVEDDPEPATEPATEPEAEAAPDLTAAVVGLADDLADERIERAAAEQGRREAEGRAHAAETEVVRLMAEIAAARARIGELERDRDDVIRRAEELLTAVRERSDQRLGEERQRADALASRVEDAWLAAAVLRSARPLRLRSSEATNSEEAQQEVLEALDDYEMDSEFAAESPEVATEIEDLRRRLRSRIQKPPDIRTVEDSVEDLREARLARDTENKGRRRR